MGEQRELPTTRMESSKGIEVLFGDEVTYTNPFDEEDTGPAVVIDIQSRSNLLVARLLEVDPSSKIRRVAHRLHLTGAQEAPMVALVQPFQANINTLVIPKDISPWSRGKIYSAYRRGLVLDLKAGMSKEELYRRIERKKSLKNEEQRSGRFVHF